MSYRRSQSSGNFDGTRRPNKKGRGDGRCRSDRKADARENAYSRFVVIAVGVSKTVRAPPLPLPRPKHSLFASRLGVKSNDSSASIVDLAFATRHRLKNTSQHRTTKRPLGAQPCGACAVHVACVPSYTCRGLGRARTFGVILSLCSVYVRINRIQFRF